MKLRLDWAPRAPRLPAWAVAVLGSWLLLVVLGVLLERCGGPALETCLLHRLSGHPCPTCGSTRVVLALRQGAWVEALRLNPLVTLGLVVGTLGFGLRLATGRALRMELSSREQRVALAIGLAALAVNWLWVLRTQA